MIKIYQEKISFELSFTYNKIFISYLKSQSITFSCTDRLKQISNKSSQHSLYILSQLFSFGFSYFLFSLIISLIIGTDQIDKKKNDWNNPKISIENWVLERKTMQDLSHSVLCTSLNCSVLILLQFIADKIAWTFDSIKIFLMND